MRNLIRQMGTVFCGSAGDCIVGRMGLLMKKRAGQMREKETGDRAWAKSWI